MDTIAAIATPPGKGGVGIVRLSGPRAEAILAKMAPTWRLETPTHTLRLTTLYDASGAPIDRALVVAMRSPHSYTGEDVVELQCHGGPVVLRRVLDGALQKGARHARPGEFTERAFLHGKLDLTQAEAVADLIDAESEAAQRLAAEHLAGGLGDAIGALLELLVECMMLVESALDFSHEEHVYQIERDEIDARLERVEGELEELVRRFDAGRRRREGIGVVVAGAANAGKSTLFNALHGTERAIVTEVAGTTRDFLEEEVLLGGVLLRLIDTAGLRATEDRVEALGIERSLAWTKRADVLLWVVDQSEPLNQEVRGEIKAELEQLEPRPMLVVLNKGDLKPGLTPSDRALLARAPSSIEAALGASSKRGLEQLRGELEELALELTRAEGVLLSRARHLQHVTACLEAVRRAREALRYGVEHELLAIDLREALDALGAIVGRVTTDDILNRIFGEFCVGK